MIRAPDVPLFTALRGDAGFAITEAIAAAAVLAILALGVLAGLDGAASSTGREKARSVASSLAEQDQERLHSMAAVDLPEFRSSQALTVGKATYNVVSEADWISDVDGGTISCTSNGGKADYLRLRSVVTSATVGSRTPPVRLESLIAPPVGSAGGNNGTLAVQVLNRDKVGVPNLSVSITGEVSDYQDSKSTNGKGCAVFAMIPGDSYTVNLNVPNWVDPSGTTAIAASGIVSPGGTTVTSVLYDIKAQVSTPFNTVYYDFSGASPGWRTKPTRAWALSLENSDLPGSGVRRFADTSGTVDPLTVQTATNLFPFKDGYGIYGGRCTEENPASTLANQPWAEVNAHQVTERNTTYDRGAGATPMPLRMPALPLRIHKGLRPSTFAYVAERNKPAWFGDANVVARLVVPDPPAGEPPACSDELKSFTEDTSWGLQSYPDARSMSGTATKNFVDGMTGFVTKKAGAGGTEFDPGLPFGTWQICADDNNGTATKRAFTVIDNTAPNSSSTYEQLDLAAGTTGKCSTRSTWPKP